MGLNIMDNIHVRLIELDHGDGGSISEEFAINVFVYDSVVVTDVV
jgi:hypothetical protein